MSASSWPRRNPWRTVVPPAARFTVVEGQFDDAEPEPLERAEVDAGKRNLNALFHAPSIDSNVRREGGGENEGNSDLEDEDDEDEDELLVYEGKGSGPNRQRQGEQFSSEELFKKFVSKIKIEKYEGVEELPAGAGNKIISASKKITANRQKVKDKQDRATVEQVMDPRTRMILYKLLSSEKILSIDGCISTGKEANVYHATGPQNTSYAIKIFKTSILTFKARDKYVTGEFRFRQGYCKKNPRKMVRVWAEKEFRNLMRIHSSGTVLVPQPRLLKSHVLVMDFIGNGGWPCPLLKDVKFDDIEFDDSEVEDDKNPVEELLKKLYKDALLLLYHLYKSCKLVHADFSEFNLILKDNKDLYVIDVSQSVEHDHPRSFDFLKSDIKNIQEFFGKKILVGDFKEIFDFITSSSVDESNYMGVLEDILSRIKKWENLDVTTEVFRQSFIPRKMEEVAHYERDYDRAQTEDTELIYSKVMGMKSDFSGPLVQLDREMQRLSTSSAKEEDGEGAETDTESDTSDSEQSGGDDGSSTFSKASRPKDETPEQKKERKKLVKQEKAEKRQQKVKKHVKKRAEKLAHHNSKRK